MAEPESGQLDDSSSDPTRTAIASVSRRFGVGHMLVATGLFATVFGALQFLEASLSAYVLSSFFCVAIPLGQLLLYQGCQPRRASCLIGARLLPVIVIGAMMTAIGPDLIENIRGGWITHGELAKGVLSILLLAVLLTGLGHGLGYSIGTISAGVFLVLDRRWNAGKPTVGASDYPDWPERKPHNETPIPATGYAWLDWIAWSPVEWFWRHRDQAWRNAVILTALAAVPLAISFPTVSSSMSWQTYVLVATTAALLIGLALSGLLLAGWRAPLIFAALGSLGAVYPLSILRQLWGWSSFLPENEVPAIAFFAGILIGVLLGGVYGWGRRVLAIDDGLRAKRSLGIGVVALGGVLLAFSCAFLSNRIDSPRERGIRQVLAAEGTVYSGSAVGARTVSVDAANAEKDLVRNIASIRELEVLVLTNASIDQDDMGAIGRLPNLKQLFLRECKFTEGAFQEIRPLRTLDYLAVSAIALSNDDFEAISNLRTLPNLELCRTEIDGSGLKYLADLPKLSYLDLTGSGIRGSGLQHIKGVAALVLDNTTVSDDDLAQLAGSNAIMSLSLSGTRVSDSGLRHLASVRRLVYLALDGTSVSGSQLAQLKTLNRLDKLDLALSQLDDEGLANLPALPFLSRLTLRGTEITGEGLSHLRRLPSLEILDLSDCEIGDQDLKPLRLLSLKELKLNGTNVSADAKDELQAHYQSQHKGNDTVCVW